MPFPESQIYSTKLFQLIHIDLWGPYHTQTYNGFKYFMTIVDDYSKATWTHLLSSKGNVFSILKTFIASIQTQFYVTIQTVRSDNAFEIGSSLAALAFFSNHGIIHQTICAHTPQQNGVVERKHKYFFETARALLFQSKLPVKYWGSTLLIGFPPYFSSTNLYLSCFMRLVPPFLT